MGIVQKIFGHATDRKLAKESATDIARLLGAKRVANQRHIIGEPFCPYKVALHLSEFWCTVFVSDTSYVFRANHKRPTAEVCSLLDVSIHVKARPNYLGAQPCKRLAKVSAAVGVPVYAAKSDDEAFISKIVLSNSIFRHLRKIDFSAISECDISQIQLSVISELRSAAQCVTQAKLFQDLVVSLFKDSQERKKAISQA